MCTRPSVVARSRASRDRVARRRRRARSLDDAARSLASADRRLADAPSDSRASDSRASRGGVESKRRARLARDSRDARAIRDSRPTDGSSLARRVRARRRSRRGRGRASPCAASRASRHASRSRRPTATDRPRVLTVYAYETVAPRRVISLFAHTRWPPARSDDTRHPLDARAATAVDDDDDDDDARAARAGVRDRRRDGGVESARARDARTHRTTRADARGDSDPHRVLRKVKLHASGEDVHR